ncbi:hypothetical protein ES703_16069 [subsurface metagenome]
MKIVSTRVNDEIRHALQEFCTQRNISVSKAIESAIQSLVQGKVKIKAVGGKDICPVCGHTVHIVQGDNSSKLYFICLNCDWAAYIGHYKLPKQIEDYQKVKEAS